MITTRSTGRGKRMGKIDMDNGMDTMGELCAGRADDVRKPAHAAGVGRQSGEGPKVKRRGSLQQK